MNRIVAVVFNDEKLAYEGSRALHELHREGSITLYADTVIAKDPGGRVSVRRAPDPGPVGAAFGLLTGSLVGLLGGPAGIAIGAGTGTLVGAALDLTRVGIGSDFVGEVSEYLLPAKTALIAELDEEWQAPLDSRMESLGGRVFRRNRIELEDAWYAKEVAAYRAEADALEAEHSKASAERKIKLDARITDTWRKLKDKESQLKARIEAVRREGDARIGSLQQQLTTARDERRRHLENRLAEVRVDFDRRLARLHEAWELTKSALTH